MSHTDNAAKTITKATPTVNLDGKVVEWEVSVEYSLNNYVATFNRTEKVEPAKAPGLYTKAELLELIDESHIDAIYESMYESTQITVEPTKNKISDFDINSLA